MDWIVTGGLDRPHRRGRRRVRSGAGEALGRVAVELVPYEGVGTVHPGVMPGLDHVRVARPDVELGAVVVPYVHVTRREHALVVHLAAVGTDDRLDAVRPTPPRLHREPRGLDGTEVDDRDLCLVGRPTLIGRFEVLLH